MKAPKLAIVVGEGKERDSKPEMDDYDASLDELAAVLGVPETKREQFREAFEAAVMSCK